MALLVLGTLLSGTVLTSPAIAGTGNYPFANYHGPGSDASQSYWTHPESGRPDSPYGYFYRNCTDFVAWKLATANQFNLPAGIGHAKSWGDWAKSQNYSVNKDPAVGSIAWWGVGTFGHVAWVKAINSNGTVQIEEYNWPINNGASYDGEYHTRSIASDNPSGYIHFKDLGPGSSGNSGSSPNWNIDSNGYWHGRPPDGMVIINGDGGGHRYVAAGGSLFYYDGGNGVLNNEFIEQMRQRHGTTQPAWMRNDEIHAIEGSSGWSNRRRPDNNTFIIDKANNAWYMMQYGFAWWLRSQQELVYLGGAGKQIIVPAHSMNGFQSAPTEWPTQIPDAIGNVTILKALDDPAFYEMQAERMYWVNNNSVLDCIVRYKGGAVQQVPLSMIHRFVDDHRPTGSIAHCTYPSQIAFFGPGGKERWHIAGSNPYTRSQYMSSLALRCWLGSNPAQVEISQAAVNQPTQVASRGCPNNTYVRNTSTQQVFQVWDGILHYISTPETLSCLTVGHPEVVIDVEEAAFENAPQGVPAHCTFEGKLIQGPSGHVYWVKDSQRRYVGNNAILHCVRVRANAGNPIPVPQGTVDTYAQGQSAYCPYPATVRFVRGEGQPQVWRVFTDGTRQHATSLCAANAEHPTTDPRFRVHVMPVGEVDGHRILSSTFSATPENCGAIP